MAGLWLQPPLHVRVLAKQPLPCGQNSSVADTTAIELKSCPHSPKFPEPLNICSLWLGCPILPLGSRWTAVVMLLSPQRTYGVPTWRRVRSWRSMGCPLQMPWA